MNPKPTQKNRSLKALEAMIEENYTPPSQMVVLRSPNGFPLAVSFTEEGIMRQMTIGTYQDAIDNGAKLHIYDGMHVRKTANQATEVSNHQKAEMLILRRAKAMNYENNK